MTYTRTIFIDHIPYEITLSDDARTLLAAKAAGRVIVGLNCQMPAPYIYEAVEGELPDDEYLERIIRRLKGLPWTISSSEELLIRELCMSDLPMMIKDKEDTPEDSIFQDPDTLSAYIRNQYGYYEYGMWAIIRRQDKTLIGIAGVTAGSEYEGADSFELGYHIYQPFRRRGYAAQACRMILSYLYEEYGSNTYVTARVKPDNPASVRVLQRLGFHQKNSDPADLWVLPPSSR